MKKPILHFFLLAYLSISLSNCANSEETTCYLPSVTATSNSPLIPGGSLQLNTPLIYNSLYTYKWTGPNGFESSLHNPLIPNVTLNMAGDYKIKVIKGICESSESIASVEITTPNIPCNPANNTMSFTGGSFSPVNFNSVYTTNNTGSFEIRAGGSNADLTIKFYNDTTPLTGIYDISNDCPTSFLTSKQVCVSLVYSNQYTNARSGKVYISLVNGKLSAIFCNVIFNPGTITLNSSTKITSSN